MLSVQSVQSFWSEVEKIAYSKGLRKMIASSRAASEASEGLGEAIGKRKKWIPFTKGHRTWWESKQRAGRLAKATEARAGKERAALMQSIRGGPVGRETEAQYQARVKKVTGMLERGPQKVSPVQRRIRGAKRALGRNVPVEEIQDPAKPMTIGEKARLGAAIGAPTLAGAAYYGYSRSRENQGYGGY